MSKHLDTSAMPALVGIIGPIIVIIGDIVASLSTPDYSPIEHSVSSLALKPIGWLQSICFLAMGLLLVIVAPRFFVNIRRARGFYAGIGLLAFCGFVLMLIATFHMDAPEGPRTTEGVIHTIASYGLGLLFPIAILSLAPSLKSTPNWKNIFIYTLFAGVLALALILGALFGNQQGWFGLYERIIILNGLIWVEVVAIHFLRLLLKPELKAQSLRSGTSGGGKS